MEWTLFIYTTLVLVSISPVSTEIPPSPPQGETNAPTELKTSTKTITTLTDVTTTQSLNNVSTPNSNIIPQKVSTSPLPPKTTTAIPISPAADPQPQNQHTSKGIALATSPSPQTTTSSSSTTTAVSSSTTTTTGSSTTSYRQHHGKKNLEEDVITSIVPIHYHSSPHPIDTNNQQIVDVPEPKDIEDVTQTEAPTSKSSLFAGLIFGSLLSLALGFLIYKRIDSARRRREYRRMNDYLIDGMYNDI